MQISFADDKIEKGSIELISVIDAAKDVADSPSFPHRSFHIDCARHFFSLEELKKMVCMAACFKFSHFHWHISDDQGWRIESRAYPLLHQTGSVRKGDHFGSYRSDQEEGGYYTREQVKELVAYCTQLGVEVVPEIDMPGHVSAILSAYPELSCHGDKVEVGMKICSMAWMLIRKG